MQQRTLGILCTSPGWGGLEINTLRLIGWLREAGWRVHLLTAGGAPIQVHAGDIPSSVSALRERGLPSRAGQLRIVHNWVRQHQIRVLLVPFRNDLKVASLYKRFYDGDMALIYQQHMQLGRSKRNLIHTLRYQMVDIWISPLNYLKEETLRLSRVPEDRIEVVPFGIDLSPFEAPAPSRKEARSLLALPESAFILGVLGRLDPKKGQMFVLQALEKMIQAGTANWELLIMGDPTLDEGGKAYARQLDEFVAKHCLKARVHFRPFSTEVIRFFRSVDVFVMPSVGETFGMVTVEAMAAGVPVLGADSDGTREILNKGAFGWLYENENPNSFCATLNSLMAADRHATILAACQQAQAQFSKEQMTRKMESLFVEMLGSHKA
ncbi:MAG: glycosyltransferase family 4 protein [Bacteroidetes bacterium]|nr:glycosyltransferase family 4 protein [Bacteroidota bacterium]